MKHQFWLFLVVFVLANGLFAMNDEDSTEVRDITELLGHNPLKNITFFRSLDSERIYYGFNYHDETAEGVRRCKSKMKIINISDSKSKAPIIKKEFDGHITVVQGSLKGDILLGFRDGRAGFYEPSNDEVRIFDHQKLGKIIALLDGNVIQSHNKKLCNVLAALTDQGILRYFTPEGQESDELSLLKALHDSEVRTDQEIARLDMLSYANLPLVAFTLKYKQLPEGKHARDIIFFNAVNNTYSVQSCLSKIWDIRFLPDATLCAATYDGSIVLLDPMQKTKLYDIQFIDHNAVVPCASFQRMLVREAISAPSVFCLSASPCGRYFATIDKALRLRIWEVQSGACLYEKILDVCMCNAFQTGMIFSGDGSQLFVYNNQKQDLYNVVECTQKQNIKLSEQERKNVLNRFRQQYGAFSDRNVSLPIVLERIRLGLN